MNLSEIQEKSPEGLFSKFPINVHLQRFCANIFPDPNFATSPVDLILKSLYTPTNHSHAKPLSLPILVKFL